ncbi:hypothetical protein EG327_000381 [Venturia inaequalis]|uniref:L-ornithine N(5)-monooxygenase [NAD(P)H] n=1 Tax=Venturia inaequalis TaxID=5025 RepID=A0A8H3VNF4_VENIN|nr:hypothetical protein EG327_000381 [Venturia inaequalis]
MDGFTNGSSVFDLEDSIPIPCKSHLQATDENELHDFVCVGFGPASLAIAVALHDSLEAEDADIPKLDGRLPKVAFLEKQSEFAWHAGMLLEGAKMQISFVKDMATLRNPRSSFTFLNYLHVKDRLVQFTNLDTFLPQRIEFEDYLRWCAGWFDDVVQYRQEVVEVRPEKMRSGGKLIDSFTVFSRDTATQQITARRAKHVIICAGGRANITRPFPEKHPRLLHSSQYAYCMPKMLTDRQAPYHIAVVGGGQSAAEIFNSLHSKYPNAATRLIIKSAALKPSDDSPFVNEIFDPDRIDPFFAKPEESRLSIIKSNKVTNYGVVRLELLEHIYQTLYMQRVRSSNEEDWQHKILAHRTIVAVDSDLDDSLRLHVARGEQSGTVNGKGQVSEILDFDAVIVATGYLRDSHEWLLKPARHLLPGGDVEGKKWEVTRDYKVKFEKGTVSDDAGVYLQGCCESTHGLADSLLSILSVRGGEIVQSIFGNNPSSSKGNAVRPLVNEIEGLDLGVKHI